MRNLSRRLFAPFGLCIILALPASALAAAPSSAVGSGIGVTPATLTFQLDDQTASQSVPITVTNTYNAPVSISAAFSGIDENADLLIPVDTLDPTFASALSISQTDTTIPAHSSQILTVQVTNTGALSAGGHYATLVLTQQDLEGHPLSIKGAVSLTIFVVKNPGAYQSINLTGLSTNHWLFRLPTRATLGFLNNGNVLAVPRATVLVFDHGGHVALQKGVANIDSHPLLPNKQLVSTLKLPSIAHTWLPQKVQLEVAYRADGASQLNTATTSFWYIPPVYLLLISPLLWLLWRQIDKRRPRRPQQRTPIPRVPPMALMSKLQASPPKPSGSTPATHTKIQASKLLNVGSLLQKLQRALKNRQATSVKTSAKTTRKRPSKPTKHRT